jgi:hypothetical protein
MPLFKNLMLITCAGYTLSGQTHLPNAKHKSQEYRLIEAHRSLENPPGRTSFKVNAPDEILFGRLWADVIWFHPFLKSQSRSQWEPQFFELLNRAVEKKAGLHELAVEALNQLHDPLSMVLDQDTGQGEFLIPALFEERNGALWIVGGSNKSVPGVLGPIDQIDGVSLDEFYRTHVGKGASIAQKLACLEAHFQRTKPFEVSFLVAGEEKTISASKDAFTDLWIDGGWNGTPLQGLKKRNGEKVLQLDLRAAHLLRSAQLQPALSALKGFRRAAITQPTYRISWQHRGLGNEFGTYSTKLVGEAIAPMQSPENPVQGSSVLPPSRIVQESLADALAGWAINPADELGCRSARYQVGALTIRLRTATYGDPPSLSLGAVASHEWFAPAYAASRSLSVGAAKALAASTVISFDHTFAFTPEPLQESAFNEVVEAYKDTSSVYDLLFRAGAAVRDAHPIFLGLGSRGGIRAGADATQRAPGSVAPQFVFPYFLKDAVKRRLTVFWTLKGVTPGLEVGTKILSVEGKSISDWLKIAEAISATRPDEPMRDGLVLQYLWQKPSLQMTIEDSKGEIKQITYTPLLRSKLEAPFSLPHRTPKKGWKYYQPSEITYEALVQQLIEGQNILLDLRMDLPGGDILSIKGNPMSAIGYLRVPTAPVSWGEATNCRVLSDDLNWGVRLESMNQMGKLHILVCGVNQSQSESHPMALRQIIPTAKLIGLPTAGITSPVVELLFPAGGADGNHVSYFPTGGWATFNGRSFHHRGLPLDRRIPDAKIKEWIRRGSQDPLLDAVISELP